ncbi:outer membrane transport energization protein ExbB [Thiopseudomonas denitrificans]|uniref:Outer membrane transport energization protein ExbB n=2 Tax=Thiopseudomonas denitrificans TaxID=1501432 RepID=A0A4R6U9Y7_9GAMM|nr:outer membrane transport energization protein ExbB [Thiopseudomonas denitrificans]
MRVSDWKTTWIWLVDSSYALLDLMSTGGMVMWMLAVLSVLFWTLVLERFWYMQRQFPAWVSERTAAWKTICCNVCSRDWPRTVRAAWMAQAGEQLLIPLGVIKALVALFPLLGLLGTVTGMVAVFDVLAMSGTGNPRAMAAGVWQATLPTLAGMVLAIGGLFSLAHLERNARRALARLADQLRHD